MARPEGAQALRAIQEALDEGRFLAVVNYIPLPRIGEGLGEWFEAPSYEEPTEKVAPFRAELHKLTLL